jgi:ELWxxDGT repeat protein
MKSRFWHRFSQSLFRSQWPGVRPRRQQIGLMPLEDRITPSLTPQMVADINQTTLPSDPTKLTTVGSLVYFLANNGIHGTELWKSDGTAGGTMLVKDIYPSNFNGYYPGYAGHYLPGNLTNVNGTLFFTANDGVHGKELWKSDGTAAGTFMVKDIVANSNGSNPDLLTNVNGTLFFTAFQPDTGFEIWKSDGTASGTVMVKDVIPGHESVQADQLVNVNGTLFFSSNDYFGNFTKLWKSDGTGAGTVLVKEFTPYIDGNNEIRNLTHVNGTVFFSVKDETHGYELWKSNGTAVGTVLVKDIYPGISSSLPSNLISVNGILYFIAEDGTHGSELWKSDGTSAGTTLVKDIYTSNASGIHNNLTIVNGMIFFTANDGVHGTELWKSDGTTAGTFLVSDIIAGSVGSGPHQLTNVNGTLYFQIGDSDLTSSLVASSELWKSEGTAAGTVRVKEINAHSEYAGLYSLTNFNGTLLFTARDLHHKRELWKSDGTSAGTEMLKDINTRTADTLIQVPAVVNETLYFVADDGVHGAELWKSDGTVAGTTLVRDIYPGSRWTGNWYYGYGYILNNSDPRNLTNVNGTLFFTAQDALSSFGLWKSDGTTEGTVKLISHHCWNLTHVNGTLYFTRDDGTNGMELWKSDGTVAGTVMVKDIYPGESYYSNPYGGGWWFPNSSNPRELTDLNGTLFFQADNGTNGRELWKSDGTAAGTVIVKDINSGTNNAFGYLTTFTNINGVLFFLANDDTTGQELWKSNGSTVGTVLVKDIRPGIAGSFASDFSNANGTLFFQANNGTTGYELWKSDGTTSGTLLVKDIRPGSGNSYPGDERFSRGARAVVNGTLFFHAFDGIYGRELWKSDGTTAGTVLVQDIYPGIGNNYTGPSELTEVNGKLFFRGGDGTTKIWLSDGTTTGTVPVVGQSSGNLTNFNNTLFFSMDDGFHGVELWKLVEDQIQVMAVTPTSTGVSVQFSRAIDPTVLNLYDQAGQFGPADVTLVGPNGPVRGSLVLTRSSAVPAGQYDGVTFIASGGATPTTSAGSVLAAGTYTLTLFSGANAFKDLDGNFLNDGNPYTTTFTVSAPPAVIVSLPSFTRGAGQSVNLPTNTAAGMPLFVSIGNLVGSVSLSFTYDNTLLNITGFTPNAAIPGVGSSFSTSTSGTTTTVTLTVTGTAAFGPVGAFTLGHFTATVPDTAPYGAKAILHVTALTAFSPSGTAVPALGADGLQLAAYVADANHNRTYDLTDLLLENRLFVGSVTGLVGPTANPTFPLVDPGLVTSIGGTATVGAADIVQLSRQLVGQTISNIAPIPNLASPPPDGADPRVYIPKTLVTKAGQTIRVPVELEVTDPSGVTAGIGAISFVIAYDPAVMTFEGISLGSMLSDPAAGFSSFVTSVSPGLIRAVVTSSRGTDSLPFGAQGTVAELTFSISAKARPGQYTLNLMDGVGSTRTAVIDNAFRNLILAPAPQNTAGDAADGIVSILQARTREARGRVSTPLMIVRPDSQLAAAPPVIAKPHTSQPRQSEPSRTAPVDMKVRLMDLGRANAERVRLTSWAPFDAFDDEDGFTTIKLTSCILDS